MNIETLNKRLFNGQVVKQRIWQALREYNSVNDERLNATAICDCTREYTFRQMFDEWEKYARVYSALGITKENKSRLAVAGGIASETLFSFFGANMTGATVSMFSYPDFLPSGKWKTMIKAENITDLVISDMMVTPEFWKELAKEKGCLEEFDLYDRIERLAPGIVQAVHRSDKQVCANVDFYSGFVYTMLNIPRELYTPIFAISRIAGWSAHRIEEVVSGGRIYRPAYKNVSPERDFIPLADRK